MKIYVASSWRSKHQPDVVEKLRAAGHEVYDFRNPTSHIDASDEQGGFHWSDIDPDWLSWGPEEFAEHLNDPIAERGFAIDLEAMQWCDCCVLVQPVTPGRSSHLELGWCAGAGKLAIILLTEGEPELMYKLANHVVVHIADVLAILDRADNLEPPKPFYILVMPWAVYVKDGEFFESQGGLTESWGRGWERIFDDDLESARETAECLKRDRFEE